MNECKVCGRKNPLEDANFCYYCGASLRAEGETVTIERKEEERTDIASVQSDVKPYTTRQWLGLLVLLLIPVWGWLVLMVILCLNLFGTKATEERRAFSKAFFLFIGVAILMFILLSMYIQSNPELMEQYNQMMQQLQGTV